ncbi:hypothetical protein QYM36_007122 [Artemia franciscana]|uniref:Uncharacterized protein n=1 Tax=Artemia franciscana TaxID=6661 RepID=A0AA88I2A2_ARTSF|nr:hypothetical protein QYM36_007122 [Artemia franciscana]
MGSIHAKSLIVLDISENSFESKTQLNNFISAFKTQMIAIAVETFSTNPSGVINRDFVELARTLQDFSVLRYLSFVGIEMPVELCLQVVQELCLCQSLKIVVLSPAYDPEYPSTFRRQLRSAVESVVELRNGSFSIYWMDFSIYDPMIYDLDDPDDI